MRVDLSRVPTAVLERLRDAIRSRRLAPPLTALSLQANGLGAMAPHVPGLAGFGQEGLLTLLDAVLAERARAPAPPELVWTGPESRGSESRDTAVVVRELFSTAHEHITLAGFRFDHGATVLSALHEAMRDRAVTCTVYMDGADPEALIRDNWPFGPPFPEVHGFMAREGVFASLHAKCVVADHRRVFVTSANFTERGQERNIEVGALWDDSALAMLLERNLQALVSNR